MDKSEDKKLNGSNEKCLTSFNEPFKPYVKKNRMYFFKQPFTRFPSTFSEATPYKKFTMIINFLIPGMGNALIGAIEAGIGMLLLFALLLGGEIYLGIVIGNGTVSTSVVTNIVVFALLTIGVLAIYYSTFSTNVRLNYRIENGYEIKTFIIYNVLKRMCIGIGDWFKNIHYLLHASAPKERTVLITSFFVMGLPLTVYKEFLKGILYFAIQFLFTFYMIARGVSDIENFFILGSSNADPLVFGVISMCIVILFILAYFKNLNYVIHAVGNVVEGRINETFKDEIHDTVNKKFYVTGLIVPIGGALIFTVIPLAFMIIVAFTNYSLVTVEGYDNLNISKNIFLTWVGLDTFKRVFYEGANLQDLLSVFSWTMIWAGFATFSCYFGGLFLAMLLNKKCIKCKLLFRSLFVIAMAMPQFVSLLTMRTMFMDQGPLNNLLISWGWIDEFVPFWENEFLAKILILFINMWVGIPYYMLLMSGLLINIPSDYYEAARIEGASRWQQFERITFPNILYMTTPLLITSFVSNINNFNVIYFLTNGGTIANGISNTAYSTDILITWLYTLTMKKFDYNFGAAIGIVMFIISASISLIIFRKSKAYTSEEAYR